MQETIIRMCPGDEAARVAVVRDPDSMWTQFLAATSSFRASEAEDQKHKCLKSYAR